jgi:ankyrin repeat protein
MSSHQFVQLTRGCEAASNGDLMAVQHLLSIGADPSARDYDRRNALHLAASEEQKGVVRLLLGCGCRRACLDRWGNAPFQDAQREGHASTASLLAGPEAA